MPKFRIKSTGGPAARSLDEEAALPVLGFAIAWSATQPHRVGEVALLPTPELRFIGRGDEAEIEKFAEFRRRRPGEPTESDPFEQLLTGDSISRRQIVVCAGADDIHVENVGRCVMLVNGVQTQRASLKPGDTLMLEGELLLVCVRREIELPRPAIKGFLHTFGERNAFGMIAESAAGWHLTAHLAEVALSDAHTLIKGESGTGKDLAAAAIHQWSARVKGPFQALNLTTIEANLVAVELFGNLKNFPNPGMPDRNGIVGNAENGTLFLDEIGNCSDKVQEKLFRLMDKGDYRRMGEDDVVHRANVRVVGATNKPDRVFMPDFRSRFTASVRIPPLRERREDIPLLIRHWLLDYARKDPRAVRFIATGPSGRPEPRVSGRLVDFLIRQRLELNARDLFARLLVAVLASSKSDVVRMPKPDISAAMEDEGEKAESAHDVAVRAAERAPSPPPPKPREHTEAEITASLDQNDWNVTEVARLLGLERSALNRRMRALGINRKKGSGE